MCRFKRAHDAVHFSTRLSDREAWLQPPKCDSTVPGSMAIKLEHIVLADWSEDISRWRIVPAKADRGRHDTDDRVVRSIQDHILSHNLRISAEMRFPEILAQHHYMRPAPLIFFATERPSDDRQRLEHLEEI